MRRKERGSVLIRGCVCPHRPSLLLEIYYSNQCVIYVSGAQRHCALHNLLRKMPYSRRNWGQVRPHSLIISNRTETSPLCRRLPAGLLQFAPQSAGILGRPPIPTSVAALTFPEIGGKTTRPFVRKRAKCSRRPICDIPRSCSIAAAVSPPHFAREGGAVRRLSLRDVQCAGLHPAAGRAP